MQIPITLLFSGVFALFALCLSALAGPYRGKVGVSILYGDPVDKELAVRVRRHQNFLEYVPMILIMMAAIELSDGSSMVLYAAGVLLFIARIAHMVGLHPDDMTPVGRLIGAGGTALITLFMAFYAVWLAVPMLTA